MQDLGRDVAAVARIAAVPTILDVVCRSTGMGFAAVARVTGDRWIACGVQDEIGFGLKPGGELEVATTICDEIRDSGKLVVIDEVATDPAFCRHPTPARYGFQSYISVPIRRADGSFFGTLCAIDPRPAKLNTPSTIGMFTLFADLIGFHLDAQERLERSEAALLDARQVSELREQFIAVLGHDLRNPLASVDAGAQLLRRRASDETAAGTLALMLGSVRRMSGLIDNLLDFARGRLGGGLGVELRDEAMGPALRQVVAELAQVHPDRAIELRIELSSPVRCDPARVGQLLSNLLANALAHGRPGAPVQVEARLADGEFELAVVNAGEAIAPAVMGKLFQPFVRAAAQQSAGLGLGLYIAAEIARAHGGTLAATSTAAETRFTFRMPAREAQALAAPVPKAAAR